MVYAALFDSLRRGGLAMSTPACSWREEGPQVKTRSARTRPGVSSVPPIETDAPNVMWAIDFQFDSSTERQGHQDRLDDRRTHP
jgi:hypothetical protein